MTDLKSCPFCGCTNIDPKFWAQHSPENDKNSHSDPCHKYGPGCDNCGATAESNEAWNRRAIAALSGPPQVEAGTVERDPTGRSWQAACTAMASRNASLQAELVTLEAKLASISRPREQEGGEAPVASPLTLKAIFVGEHTISALRALKNVRLESHGVVLMPASDMFETAAHPPLPTDGWVLVPVDPTDEMADKGDNYLPQFVPDTDGWKPDGDDVARDVYLAMIACAPTPPASTEGGADA